MKKYIFMAVAGMLALSSCSNDDNDQTTQNAPQQMTFTAGFGDGATTRATLDGSTKKVSFEKFDDISILSANNTNTRFTTDEGGASATFTGTATADSKFYAVYPYTDGLTLDASTGIISGVTIPYMQTGHDWSDCGWDPTAPIAYATTTGTSLQFHNACALLKITNDRGDANDINVQCDDALTGTFSLNTSSGALSGTNTRTYALAGNVSAGKTIYIAIAPGTKTNFMAIWSGGSGVAMKQKSSFTFEAGKIYNLGNTSAWTQVVTNLSTISEAYTASDGETLTGTLGANVKISIAAGATVMLDGVNITNLGSGCDWAGINCPGDATIILKGDNEVCAGRDGDDLNNYPGIWIAPGKTLNIMGDGSLTAYSAATDPSGAGIGGGYDIDCGNINISGGTINATGGVYAAGIGSGNEAACGTITISGGTITATGGTNSPGIGSGDHGSCAGITISGGTVTASSSTNQSTAIGRGVGGSCTSVTITTGITSLTMTNSYASITGIVSDFINATAVNANTTPITYMLPTSVTDPTIIGGMAHFGFATSYNEGTKTWTVTK